MNSLFTYYTQVIFLCCVIFNHLFEIYLSRRQVTTLHQHRGSVPEEFKNFLSLEDHQKAVNYATAKLKFGQKQLVWDVIVLFAWFPMKGAEKLYLAMPGSHMHREVLFLFCFFAIQGLISIPWAFYSNFVIEEKFGFNKMTAKLFITDRIKGMLLGALLAVPLLYGILYIFNKAGSWWWIISFVFMTAVQFALVWLYPTVIAPLFNTFKPLEAEELKNGIENLVTRAGFHAKEVFIMDASKRSSHGNAYFTGFGKNKRVVFFDTLLKDLANNEILAILAHELGHMKLKHIPKSLITSLVISFFGFWLMGKLSTESWFFGGHFIRVISPGVLFLIFLQAIPIYTFWFGPIFTYISRKREFEADAYAAGQMSSEYLISGLLKLYQQNASPVVTDKIYSGFYHSHPPALERIKKLESFK